MKSIYNIQQDKKYKLMKLLTLNVKFEGYVRLDLVVPIRLGLERLGPEKVEW